MKTVKEGYIDEETSLILIGLGDYIWKMHDQLEVIRAAEGEKLGGLPVVS